MSNQMSGSKVAVPNPQLRTRSTLRGTPHVTLAVLFAVSQLGFIYLLHNRSHTLVYSILAVTLGSIINVYLYTRKSSSRVSVSALVSSAVVQSIPLNVILYAVAYFKEHINDFLDQRQVLHSRTTVVSTAFLYAVTTSALILSAYVQSELPRWVVRALEGAAFLSLVGHIVVTTSDTEGLIDILTMSAAALATFSTKLYWSQSFEVFHPPGAHGHYDGPVDSVPN